MRYLVLSDIHGNWEALEAVLEHLRNQYDRVLCCGDLVGYGADPNRVVDWVRANAFAVVRGNHDKACAGLDDLEWFNPVARAAAEWTGRSLTPENLDYLRALPRGPLPVDSFQILHGSPLDEDDYLVSSFSVSQICGYLEKQVSIFGHTHLQGGFLCHRNGVKRIDKPRPGEIGLVLQLEPDVWYLINPGSVGQPRDGDARAACAIYDPAERLVDYRRIPYDIGGAKAKIVAAGLPDALAARLDMGT
ncbi:MAG TPA: metallophosphoesterase family protein [Bryobacteraceae bacterium]|nr:metallophosphoesterase family protein [Bryobacteraceae bacterium]